MGISTAIAAGTAVVSAGVGIFGLSEQQEGREKQDEATAQQVAAAKEQARISALQAQLSAQYAGIEAGITSKASEQSYAASSASADINQGVIGAERGIESQKRSAMELSAKPQQLEIIRNQQRARSLGLTTATAQGAAQGSGLQGAYGQISGQTGVNILGVQQNLEVGRNIFDLNRTISERRIDMSNLQRQYARQQADVTTEQAGAKFQYAQAGADLATQYAAAGGNLATAQGLSSAAQGQISFGGSLVNTAGSIFNIGQVGAKFAGGIGFGNSVDVGSATSF